MIKNIILDLAGVVLNLNLERDTKALNDVGLPVFSECVKRPEIARPMLAYLNGLMEENDFVMEITPVCSEGVTREAILYAMDAVLDDIPHDRLQMIAQLRKQYRIILLSNIYETAWQHAVKEMQKSGYEPNDCFDDVFLSYEMQLAKPDPRIFLKVIETTGIVPEETLYFDDSRENIESGNALGLHSVLVPMNELENVITLYL